MKKTALAIASALLLLTACDSSSDADGNNTGTGFNNISEAQRQFAANVGDRVFFALDSSTLSGEAQATLDRQAGWLKENSGVNIVIEGHADERGTREYNIALGERRATAAKNYLVNLGVAASRLSTVSYGKERPAVMGSDESAWSQNRRAVTVLAN